MKKYNQIIKKWEEEYNKSISDNIHIEYLKELLIYINNNKSNIDIILQNLEISSAGFGKLKLSNNKEFSSELHFFLNNEKKISTNIHTHGYDAYSHVLSGQITEEQFSVSKIGKNNPYGFLYNNLQISINNQTFEDFLIKLYKIGIINVESAIYFVNNLKTNPQILNQIIKDLNLILINKNNYQHTFWSHFLSNSVLGININKLAEYFIHFEIEDKKNGLIKKISQNTIKYIGNRVINEGSTYYLPINLAHRVSIDTNTTTLFIKNNTNNLKYHGGHFKLLPQVFDSFEEKKDKTNYDIIKLKKSIFKEIGLILYKLK